MRGLVGNRQFLVGIFQTSVASKQYSVFSSWCSVFSRQFSVGCKQIGNRWFLTNSLSGYFTLRRHVLLAFLVAFLSFTFCNAQYDIPEKPTNEKQTFVYDYIVPKLLSKRDSTDLAIKLKKYSDTTSTQIVIAVIASTKGENINYLGAQWGEKWGIGQAEEDNGILILLAKDDRRIAINTGYGVEHLLTDAMCKRIIERDIIPYFKRNDYYGGLDRGIDAIFEVLYGEYKVTRKLYDNKEFYEGIRLLFIFVFIFIIIIISISKNKRVGSFRGGSFGSGSTSSRSGGFGGGFGGGGFGGGGASGGW